MLIDVHTHLDDEKFSKDVDQVIKNAEAAKVVAIINNGINIESNRKTLELAKKYPIVKASLGMYPIDAIKLTMEKIEEEIAFIEHNKKSVMAIGEIGLDKHHDTEHFKEQLQIFEKFIRLAERINVPVIVHSRKAEKETMLLLESSALKRVIMHCFNGSVAQFKNIADLGWYFSIPCSVVRDGHFQRIVKETNVNQLFCETDAPYLGLTRSQRSEPAHIAESIKKIAELKGLDVEETTKNIYMNYRRFFRI